MTNIDTNMTLYKTTNMAMTKMAMTKTKMVMTKTKMVLTKTKMAMTKNEIMLYGKIHVNVQKSKRQ